MKNKKIKIIHITRFAHPHIGGVESVVNQINESLSNEEFEKEVFCCSNTDKSSFENGVKYNRCRYLFDFAANSISPQLFFRMMFLKTDIIHFHMPVIQNVVIWFILYHLGLLRYKKMVITCHGSIIGYDKYMKYFWWLYRYFYRKADLIHVLSPTFIESDKIMSLNKEKCTVIPYGVCVNKKNFLEQNMIINGINIKQVSNGYKKILCMGRLVKLKGFHILIQTMQNIDGAILFIVGDGPEYKDLKKCATSISKNIIFLGNITKEEEKEFLFSNTDIFVIPSLRTESFGIVQLEAMKYSKPVINTNLRTGVNYVSIDKETGITVEPNNVEQLTDAINELLNNNELRNLYGKNARKRVENLFNIENIKEKYRALYIY